MVRATDVLNTEIKSRWIRWAIFGLAAIIVILVLVSNYTILKSADGSIYEPDNIPSDLMDEPRTAIVLGASATKSRLNKVYELRVSTALDLYNLGMTSKILISGDGRGKYYNEIVPAVDYLLNHEVLREDIVSDSLGLDTYDSISRAKSMYGISRAIVVSQGYHLPRAVYIAKSLGMDVVGIKAGDASLGGRVFGNLREIYARVKAFIEVQVRRIFQ